MNFFTPFELPTGAELANNGVCANIMDFGAVSDGITSCTEAFRAAIAYCAERGGGRVLVPAGRFYTAPIQWESNIEVHLENAHIIFSAVPEDCLPPVLTLYEGVRGYTYSAMLYACGKKNIALTGWGTLDGQGDAWWPWRNNNDGTRALYAAGLAHTPVEERVCIAPDLPLRPGLLHFIDCENVTVEGDRTHGGLIFTMSPFWSLHPTWCTNVIFRNVAVRNPFQYAPNTDGLNFEGCKRGLAENIFVSTGDDALCLKAGRDEDGRVAARPCEDIIIRGLKVRRSHGGITIGSEMSGGVRNILAEDIELADNYLGVWIKTAPERGGVVEDVIIRNLRGKKIHKKALCFSMGYYVDGNEPYDNSHLPSIRRIAVEDFSCEYTALGLEVYGLADSPITDVCLENVQIKQADKHREVLHAVNLTEVNCKI